MKKLSNLSFKHKLLAIIVLFALLPIMVIVYVLNNVQSEAEYERNHFYQTSNNIQIIEFIDSYYYRNVKSIMEALQGKRSKIRMTTSMISDAINFNNIDEEYRGISSIIRDTMFDASHKSGLITFIYDRKNPSKSYFVKASSRKILNFVTILNQPFHEFVKERLFYEDGSFHVLIDPQSSDVYLGLISALDDHRLLVVAENENELQHIFRDTRLQIFDALNNVYRSEGRKLSANKTLYSFIVDKDGKQVVPKKESSEPYLYLDEETRLNISSVIPKKYNYRFNEDFAGKECQMLATYYRPLNLYVVSATPKDDILKAQRKISGRFTFIGVIISLIALCIATLFISDLLTPLTRLTKHIQNLTRINLNKEQDVEDFISKFDVSKQDEVGEISTAIQTMTSALSSNMRKLIETQDNQRKIESELNTAKDIQKGILPEGLDDNAAFNPLKLHATLVPAKEVGGDLYDAISLDEDHVAVIIGDVSDKGVPAALFMTMTVIVVRECFSLNMTPAEVMNEVNKSLSRHNPNMMFVTLFLGVINKRTGEFCYANGGHCQPVICHDGDISLVEGLSGPAPGVVDGYSYKEFKTEIPMHSKLYLYTDGVSEAQNPENLLFGENRIYECVKKYYKEDVRAFTDNMMQEIITYREDANQSDDITMLVIDL